MKIKKKKGFILSTERTLFWGISMLLLALLLSLSAYYLYSQPLRYFSFLMLLISLSVLFWSMSKDLISSVKYSWVSRGLILSLILIYFMQRMEFHRFDFMVGDASDYFAAGICAVTYKQDIGYILPLAATFTSIGYDLFGIEYALLPYVVFYISSIPISYFILRKLQLDPILSLITSILLIFAPLSIWYAKSTFSETIWQILILILLLNTYSIMKEKTLSFPTIIFLYISLFLAPLLRVDGILLYGFILFIALFHFWKFSNLKSAIWISAGLYILAASAHIALLLRPGYLLDRQYNRIIPDATTFKVMLALYILATLAIGMIFLVHFIRKKYTTFSFPRVFIIFSLLAKMGIVYVYASKKQQAFLDMLLINEYDFAVGNFGIPIALFMMFGLILLYMEAWKGKILPLLIVALYTIFYIPFIMQAVTFIDPHAFFLYWNRYYFSILMIIHIFAVGIAMKFTYNILAKFINNSMYQKFLFSVFIIMIIISSMSLKLQQIVVKEAHLKNSYTFYTWIKQKVGWNPLALVTDKSIIYRQNARPDGQEAMKYFTVRTFSIHKMYIKSHQTVDEGKLYYPYPYTISSNKIRFVICIGTQECKLQNEKLIKVDTFTLPLEWREHFGLDKNASLIHRGDVTQSIIKRLPFHATLYKVKRNHNTRY